MEKITHIQHPREGTLLSIAYLIQSIAYYSIQGSSIIYTIELFMENEMSGAIELYGLISIIPVISVIVGGLLGDLLLGNRNTMIVGGTLQAIAAFLMFIPNEFIFYTGVVLLFIGLGLYRPNLKALLGKAYLDRPKLLDGGFSLLYLSFTLGSFIGLIIAVLIVDVYGYEFTFLLSGGLMIMGLIPFFFLKESPSPEKSRFPNDKRNGALKIVVALLLFGFFLSLINFADFPAFILQGKLKSMDALSIPKTYWQYLPKVATIIILTLITILWKIIFIDRKIKLLISAIAGLLSFIVLLFSPDYNQSIQGNQIFVFLAFILLMAIGKAILEPIINAWIIQYGNKKYYATLLSFTSIPAILMAFLINSYWTEYIHYSFKSSLYFGIVGMAILAIATIVYMIFSKSNEKKVPRSKDLLDS